jgi:hypothetical protein
MIFWQPPPIVNVSIMNLVRLSLPKPSSTMSKDMIIGILTQFCTKVNAWYIGSKVTKNTLFISPYKIL